MGLFQMGFYSFLVVLRHDFCSQFSSPPREMVEKKRNVLRSCACEADCLALRDAILEKPAKRQKESTSEYTTPNSTTTPHGDNPAGDAGDATSLTTNEAQKNVQAAAGFRVIMHHTHGLQSRAGSANEEHRKKLPTTPQGQAIYDDLVSKVTTTPRTQPETPSSLRQQTGDIDTPAENDYTPTFHIQPPTPATYGVLVGRETIALTPVEGHFTTTPTKKRDRHKIRHNSGRYEGRGPTKQ